MNGFSVAFSIGKPVWRLIIDVDRGIGFYRFVFAFFAIQIMLYDFDLWQGKMIEEKWVDLNIEVENEGN